MTGESLDLAKPDVCQSVGLECHSCAAQRGRQIASLCGNLSATGIESAFLRMYPESACSPMLPNFAQAYFEATEIFIPLPARAVAVA